MGTGMQLNAAEIDTTCRESVIYQRLLALDNKHILELGCGNAEKTIDIAGTGINRRITALEVDAKAYRKNLSLNNLANVTFGLAGAEDIPLKNESVDVVLMFKSLHHVPRELMLPSMQEIRRVLVPGGLAYISEPVFAGEFNEILRLFNDEQDVRQAAFNALQHAVELGWFRLVEEIFFYTPSRYRDFAEFEDRIINATHSQYRLDEALYQRVKQRFEKHLGNDGAEFLTPVRVDLLQKL